MTQHARITPDQVQAMRGLGLLTIPGYLYLYILSRRRVGWALRIPSVVQFCRHLKDSSGQLLFSRRQAQEA